MRRQTVPESEVLVIQLGNFWAAISPDGQQVIYRILGPPRAGTYIVSTAGGTPRFVQAMDTFNLASDWSEGRQVLLECQPTTEGLCTLDMVNGDVKNVLKDPQGELLDPSRSWDGKWLTFMRRRAGQTAIWATPLHDNSGFATEANWVEVTPCGRFGLPAPLCSRREESLLPLERQRRPHAGAARRGF